MVIDSVYITQKLLILKKVVSKESTLISELFSYNVHSALVALSYDDIKQLELKK